MNQTLSRPTQLKSQFLSACQHAFDTRLNPCETTPALVVKSATNFSNNTFIEEGNLKLTFSDFLYEASRIAGALMANGIKPGDRVAIWAPNIHEWIIAALGTQFAGAVLVTLNTRYKGSEAAYILQKSRAKALFCIGEFLGVDYPQLIAGESLPDLEHLIVIRGEAPSNDKVNWTNQTWDDLIGSDLPVSDEQIIATMASVQASDSSDILFTSGTTGDPKGVVTAHGQNLKAFSAFSDIVGLTPGDRYLVINPFFHSFGYKAGILASLLKGVTLLPHAVFDAEIILKRIAEDKISVLPGPPTLFQSLLASPNLQQYDISSLKRATTGAAVIPVEMIHQMKDILGFETVITAYGLTESCGLVTMCRQGDSAEIIATTSGRAIPDVEVRCVDTQNQPVKTGEAGEIVVRGYNVMQGYFENDQATEQTIDSEGWLHTGDIGIMDEQGYLKITDRLKDMFITGGFNCYPAEIEKIIAAHPAIAMNAVIGVPDERMGEVAMAFVVLKPDHQLDQDEFITWCREKMANYKVPRHVVFTDALPLNASGKVVKPELRKLASQ